MPEVTSLRGETNEAASHPRRVFCPAFARGLRGRAGSTGQTVDTNTNTVTTPPPPPPAPPTAEMIAAQKKAAEESRQKVIASLKDNLAGVGANWKATLQGSTVSPLCEFEERFDKMKYVFTSRSEDITWEDLGTSEEDARANLKKAATAYAKEALKVVNAPMPERKKMGMCGGGEGAYDLTDTGTLLRNLSDALETVNMRPEDLGTTAQKMRAKLQADLTELIAAAKARGEEGEEELQVLAARADYWNFRPEDVGLNTDNN
jgi:hypothetical protein